MPLKFIESREAYSLADPLHIQRWMCQNCGLILDYQFDPEVAGWPKFEPPWHASYDWIDEHGNFQSEEPERNELCPRCEVSLDTTPPISIVVREVKTLNDFIEAGEGEGETLEFKEDLSVENLRKTIAAFATTKGGRIVLGINKNYQRVGYQGNEKIYTPKGREDLQTRLRSKVLDAIKPRPSIHVDFVSEGGNHFAVVTVIKGPEPIYYSKGTPYVRDLDQSRPATPEEVKALIKEPKTQVVRRKGT